MYIESDFEGAFIDCHDTRYFEGKTRACYNSLKEIRESEVVANNFCNMLIRQKEDAIKERNRQYHSMMRDFFSDNYMKK